MLSHLLIRNLAVVDEVEVELADGMTTLTGETGAGKSILVDALGLVLGVRAVAIVSPFYYKLTPAGVYAYFKEIADNSPIDVTLYNIPMFASPIDVPTIKRLSVALFLDDSIDDTQVEDLQSAVKAAVGFDARG